MYWVGRCEVGKGQSVHIGAVKEEWHAGVVMIQKLGGDCTVSLVVKDGGAARWRSSFTVMRGFMTSPK
jgi:hypothetical protein